MNIDIDQLREDMKLDCYAAYFGAGFGAAIIESFEIDDASPEELIDMAEQRGIDLSKYEV